MPVEITSRRNDLIRKIFRLSGSAACRREEHRFVAEGARLCADAAVSGAEVTALLFTERAEEKYAGYLEPVRAAAKAEFRISPSVASFLSDTKTPQGIFCVCAIPPEAGPFPDASEKKDYLFLENMQDPANMGAVFRTAEALGFGGVFLGGSCCDAFSPKVLRAGMGSVFRLPLFREAQAPAAVRRLNEAGFATLAAVPHPPAVSVTSLRYSVPSVAVIGNEGSGLTPETCTACSARVSIPMAGRAESLNATAAAAILMWEMVRGKAGGGCS